MGKRTRGRVLLACVVAAAVGVLFGVGSAGANSKAFVGCGSTLTSSLTLNADMNCTDTTALYVGADGITINLNGHTIADLGGGNDLETGIAVEGYDKVKIRNGTIKNFATGIWAGGVGNLTVQDMAIVLDGENDCDEDTYGVFIGGAEASKVTRTTVTNTGDALLCDSHASYGIFLVESGFNTFTQNTVSDTFFGFADFFGGFNTWSNSQANMPFNLVGDVSEGLCGDLASCPATGFLDYHGWGNSFVGDAANGGSEGFLLYSEGNYVKQLKNSTANGNSFDGVYLHESNDGPPTIVSGNTFSGNGQQGIHGAYDLMTVSKNVAAGNGSHGFNFWAACNSSFKDNKALNNNGDGFRLRAFCGNETVEKNTANDNSDDGFDFHHNDTCTGLFQNNKAFGNGDHGAWAINSIIPGIHNTTDTDFYNVNIAKECEG